MLKKVALDSMATALDLVATMEVQAANVSLELLALVNHSGHSVSHSRSTLYLGLFFWTSLDNVSYALAAFIFAKGANNSGVGCVTC